MVNWTCIYTNELTFNSKIQDWVDRDLIVLKKIHTHDNCSDAMTKNLPKILFHRHMDMILGWRPPKYVNYSPKSILETNPSSKHRGVRE